VWQKFFFNEIFQSRHRESIPYPFSLEHNASSIDYTTAPLTKTGHRTSSNVYSKQQAIGVSPPKCIPTIQRLQQHNRHCCYISQSASSHGTVNITCKCLFREIFQRNLMSSWQHCFRASLCCIRLEHAVAICKEIDFSLGFACRKLKDVAGVKT
jgi:hypothetical protein